MSEEMSLPSKEVIDSIPLYSVRHFCDLPTPKESVPGVTYIGKKIVECGPIDAAMGVVGSDGSITFVGTCPECGGTWNVQLNAWIVRSYKVRTDKGEIMVDFKES